MKIYEHSTYQEYVDAQVGKNKEKFDRVSVKAKTIKWIADYIVSRELSANNIICHGVRNGKEIRNFKKYFPDAKYVGTDISDTVIDYDFGVQHDFHDSKAVWAGLFDVLYTNSLDHSYDPQKAIEAFKESVTPNGALFIEWSEKGHGYEGNELDAADCFQASLEEYIDLFVDHFKVIETHKIDKITHLIVARQKTNERTN